MRVFVGVLVLSLTVLGADPSPALAGPGGLACTDTLTAWWPGDSNLRDVSGNGYDGTLSTIVSGGTNAWCEICGDGGLDAVEQCDDGNVSSGDGCSSACVIEPALPPMSLWSLFALGLGLLLAAGLILRSLSLRPQLSRPRWAGARGAGAEGDRPGLRASRGSVVFV
ncbi:MAG: DUF4215 domain-containing protein [Candidatus Binatia bacterium]|nr:DUF4215 domain-containing protein [Candidatus Binatia bacterium]